MKIKHVHRTSSHTRQVKKPRRRLLFAGIFIVLLLFCSYSVTSFDKDTSVKTVPLQAALPNDLHLDWPAVGQAAVGSIEDGLLARSSDNEDLRPTASMAKVIAALAVMEKQPLELGQTGPSYTLTSEDVANYRAYVAKGGSVLPVREGMMVTQYQIMQMMLIASANNMADTLVEREFGSMEAYVSYAQNMLQRMGLSRTVVADASGFSPTTVSTPSELVAIGIAALKNPVIAEIVAQPQAWISGAGTITNTNKLLGADGVVGIKTGTTDEAGSCLMFAARYDAKDGQTTTIVGVVMGNKNAASLFINSRELLASAKQAFGLVEAQPAGSVAAPPPQHRDRSPRQ